MQIQKEKVRFADVNQTATAGVVATTAGTNVLGEASTDEVRIYKTVIPINSQTWTVDVGAGGSDDGRGFKLLDLPEGGIYVVGAKIDVDVTCAAGTSAASAVIALGTVIATADNAALTSTEADIVASQTLGDGTLTASTAEAVSLFVGAGANGEGAFLDGSATAKDVFLNIAGTWTKASGSTSTFTLSGQVELMWAWMGDD